MTINLVVGEVRYSPARDIAYLWPSLLSTVADRLEDTHMPVLHQWLRDNSITLDDLGAAAKAYCEFINLSHQELDLGMQECLNKSGWEDVKPEAQVAYLFYAGALLTGTFFKGIRDAVPASDKREMPVMDDLHQAARQFEAYVSMPGWQRKLCKVSKWFNRMFLRAKAVRRPV